MSKISVVTPVYNSEGSLKPLTEHLKASIENINGQFEVIMVHDGSSDNSWGISKSYTKKILEFMDFS